jgi:PQQ-dependent dehydrogenase (s-GDH family)
MTRALVASVIVSGITGLLAAQDAARPTAGPERFQMRVVASGLDAPWEVAWGPDEQLWVTERRGRRIVRINPADGARRTFAIADAHQGVAQDGLLGLAFHPDFLRGTGQDFVFVAFTYDDAPGTAMAPRMAIRRYQYDAKTRNLGTPVDVLTGLPAHDDHLGGRLAIGPDRKLYLTIGDQGSNFGGNRCNVNRAQQLPTAREVASRNWIAYQGKILRIDLDGSIPADNPVLGGVRSHVFSVGHRNPLGLAFGPGGLLYESEHGPSTDDEVNLIEAGRNYGWPHVAGYRDDKAYAYANWSASSPARCADLAGGEPPPSVPQQAESSWTHPQFTPPLQTFFTVETGTAAGGIGGATIAPGGVEVYAVPGERGIRGWSNSVLVLGMIRGTVYRLPLSADGRTAAGPPLELFQSANRYRDIAIAPDGRRIYIVTDPTGTVRVGGASPAPALANPGALLEFTVAQ